MMFGRQKARCPHTGGFYGQLHGCALRAGHSGDHVWVWVGQEPSTMGEGWEQQREELVARLPDEPFDPHTPNPSPVQETAREMQRTWEREVKDWLSTPPGLCAKCNGMGEVMHEGFGYYRPIGGMSTGNRSERVTCPTCDGKKYPPFLLGDDQ